MAFADETRMTEIHIAADGRIYVFGASRDVIGLLADIQLGDPTFDRRAHDAVARSEFANTDAPCQRPKTVGSKTVGLEGFSEQTALEGRPAGPVGSHGDV